MEQQLKKLRKLDVGIFLLGGLLPLIVRLIFPETYHHFDVETFVKWGGYHDNLSDLYITDCYCNYPYLGLLMSTGLLRLLGDSIFAFTVVLALFDFLNVYLISRILKALRIQRSLMLAGLIGMLPAIWIGGGLWGQIDTIGQSIILLLLFTLIRHLQTNQNHAIHYAIYGLFFAVGLLTKQLLLFPMAPFGVFLLIRAFYISPNPAQAIKLLVIAAASFVLPIILIDLALNIPDQYLFSHLERVFLEGSDHMNEISGNGFNIWMLFYSEMGADSTTPLLGLSPKIFGLIFFIGLFVWLIVKHWKLHQLHIKAQTILVSFLFMFLLVNLGFNLFLTGTHERYLYHFYPFLGIALLYSGRLHYSFVQRFDFIMFFLGSIFYGLFVLGILHRYHLSTTFFGDLWAHRILVIFHLILFVRLMYQYNKLHTTNMLQKPINE